MAWIDFKLSLNSFHDFENVVRTTALIYDGFFCEECTHWGGSTTKTYRVATEKDACESMTI